MCARCCRRCRCRCSVLLVVAEQPHTATQAGMHARRGVPADGLSTVACVYRGSCSSLSNMLPCSAPGGAGSCARDPHVPRCSSGWRQGRARRPRRACCHTCQWAGRPRRQRQRSNHSVSFRVLPSAHAAAAADAGAGPRRQGARARGQGRPPSQRPGARP
jgi:hypothetical protein